MTIRASQKADGPETVRRQDATLLYSIFEPRRQEPCYVRKQNMTMAGSSHDPERSKTMKGPFGPDRPPTQNLNFRLRRLSAAIQPEHYCMAALSAWMLCILWLGLGWLWLIRLVGFYCSESCLGGLGVGVSAYSASSRPTNATP